MATPPPYTVKVLLDQNHVSPPRGSVSTTTIPLTFFDIYWLFCCPMQRIFFYEFPYPTLHFTQTILPHLKDSLSLTLQHFFPFAGNLICPPPQEKPYILFREGDSVPITIAESDVDFNHLVSNHPRDVKPFQSLVPKLPIPYTSSNNTDVVPIMAMQFTVFPNSGISIGITFSHLAADGRSFNHFMKFWAQGGEVLNKKSLPLPLPYHNKDVIEDPNGLSSIFFKDCLSKGTSNPSENVPVDNVRVTLVISRAQIEKLKQLVSTQGSDDKDLAGRQLRVSTYVVTCAFMWVNLIRLQESHEISSGDSYDDDMIYHFVSVADCRDRLDEFPVPATYFGNCLAMFFVSAKRSELMGKDGFAIAAKAIGAKISELEKGPLIGAEKWMSNLKEIIRHGRMVSVAGSPKLSVYETDFGWGRPKKSEVVHIGAYGAFSLAECKDEQGGAEIGIVIGPNKIDVFNNIFVEELNLL